MESDKTQVDWLEPGWRIVVRKRSFRHIFISKGGGRWLKLAAIPYLLFLAAAYILGVMELAQNRKVIFLATGMLIGFPFALTAMEYLFQFLKLPRGVLLQTVRPNSLLQTTSVSLHRDSFLLTRLFR